MNSQSYFSSSLFFPICQVSTYLLMHPFLLDSSCAYSGELQRGPRSARTSEPELFPERAYIWEFFQSLIAMKEVAPVSVVSSHRQNS